MRLGYWWSRKKCPKVMYYEFQNNMEQNSRETNSPKFQVREQVSVFLHLLFNAKKFAAMILRRGEFLSFLLSLVCLQLCFASECLETVKEVCHEVIVENNDQLLETMEEMVSNRSCNASNPLLESQLNELNDDLILHFSNVSNQIRDMKEDTRNTMEQQFEQLFQKMANSTLG